MNSTLRICVSCYCIEHHSLIDLNSQTLVELLKFLLAELESAYLCLYVFNLSSVIFTAFSTVVEK